MEAMTLHRLAFVLIHFKNRTRHNFTIGEVMKFEKNA
jgi:hypothetical protein